MDEVLEERTHRKSFDYLSSLKMILTHPGDFFDKIKFSFKKSTLFLFITTFIVSLLIGVVRYFTNEMPLTTIALLLVLFPLYFLVIISISSIPMTIFIRTLGEGESEEFSAKLKKSYYILSYSSAGFFVFFIPLIGFVAPFFSWYLIIRGISNVEETSLIRSFFISLLTFTFTSIVGALGFGILAMTLSASGILSI